MLDVHVDVKAEILAKLNYPNFQSPLCCSFFIIIIFLESRVCYNDIIFNAFQLLKHNRKNDGGKNYPDSFIFSRSFGKVPITSFKLSYFTICGVVAVVQLMYIACKLLVTTGLFLQCALSTAIPCPC